MNRRQFLQSTAAAVAATALNAHVAYAQDQKPLRVGLIGPGWYGKCDILRLIQIAPVEIVSLCDVDKKMLAEAVALYLETCFENNLPYVRPVPREEDPRLRPLDNFLELFPLKVDFKVRTLA